MTKYALLIAAGRCKPRMDAVQDHKSNMYEQDFEMAFLTTTADYYSRGAKQLLAEGDAVVFMVKVGGHAHLAERSSTLADSRAWHGHLQPLPCARSRRGCVRKRSARSSTWRRPLRPS